MKQLFLIICFLGNFIFCEAQQLGSWRYYLPSSSAKSVAIDDAGIIYCGTASSFLFSFDNEDRAIKNYVERDGLSQAEVEHTAWNSDYQLLVIAYQNADIDLWFEEEQVYVPEIRISNLQGDKTINHISFHNELMYLSCAFGIVVYDLEKLEVRDTYFLGEGSSQINIFATKVFNNKIYAATENGILSTNLNNPNLSNVEVWGNQTPNELEEQQCLHIFTTNDYLYAAFNKNLFRTNGNEWENIYQPSANYILKYISVTENEIALIENEINELGEPLDFGQISFLDINGNFEAFMSGADIRKPLELKADKNGNYWLADEWNALLKISDRTAKEWIRPNGPKNTDAHKLIYQDNTLWVAAGGVGRNGNSYLGKQAAVFNYKDGKWTNYDQYNEPLLEDVIDILDIVPDPVLNKVWVSSYRNGLLEYEDGHFINKYDKENSVIKSAAGDAGSSRIRGIELDNNNNLWMCNHASPNPIIVKTAEGIWQALGQTAPTYDLHDLTIDQQGNKWFATISNGLVAYNSGEDILNSSDDQYVQYKKSNSELDNDRITALAIDQEGQVWIGTKEGVYVIYCPYATFNGGCPPSRPTIENPETGELGYVLWFDFIRCIAIDAANRKWIGTSTGLWVFDADVREAVHNFTAENSPLPDSDILSLSMNNETGEVFIGTAKGIVSYQNTAIEGSLIQNKDAALVYPNPVRPEYNGDIAIKGLVDNAQVKITDMSGTLVYETQALGGQAVWNGFLLNGQRAASGVYIIYSTNTQGQEKYAGKFVIIN